MENLDNCKHFTTNSYFLELNAKSKVFDSFKFEEDIV